MAERTRRQAPLWLQWSGQAISFIVLAVSALAALILILVPLVTGSQTYTVLTSSMAPHYAPGTFLVVKPQDFDTMQTGDVITYQIESGRPEVITHRITTITADQNGQKLLITQGDNNDVADPAPVRELQVRGKLFYAVPYVGFVANALGQTDRGSITTILAVGLIGFGVLSMGRSVIRNRRDARDRTASNETEQATDQQAMAGDTPKETS